MAKLIALVVAILFVVASLKDELWVKITFFIVSFLVGILIDVFAKEIKSQKTHKTKKEEKPESPE